MGTRDDRILASRHVQLFVGLSTVLGCFGCVYGSTIVNDQLDTEIITFNDWQISQSRFCPEEPVVIYARISNVSTKAIELTLVPRDSNRALVLIKDSEGNVVWDTDTLDRLEEVRHAEEHGIGRIFAGPVFYHKTLEPGATTYWISRWEQRDLEGELVPHGEYFVEVEYRWVRTGDDGDRKPVSIPPTKFVVSNVDCD